MVAAGRPPGRAGRLAGRWGVTVAQPEESFVELREGRFKIRTLQAGSGDPFLYVHGAGGLFWDPLLDALAAAHRVDRPGAPGRRRLPGDRARRGPLGPRPVLQRAARHVGIERATRRRPLVRRHGRRRARRHQPTPRRQARADRADRAVARRPPGAGHLRHPARELPALVFADPGQPDRGIDAGAGPDRPRVAVPGLADDGEHPAVHLAAARQGPVEAAVPAQGADAARVGGPGRLVHPAYGEDFAAASPARASRSSRAPATCRSSSRPSARSALITEFIG